MTGFFSNVNHRDVFKASEIFHGDYVAYDEPWLKTMREIDWSNIHQLDSEIISNEIIGFLNKWKCRLPYSKSLAKGIKEKFEENTHIIDALKDTSIEKYNPKEKIRINGSQYTVEDAFYRLFKSFVDLPFNFSTVAATKLLHFPLPSLIVMWDTPISENYRLSRTPRNYVYRFIPLMHTFSQTIIDTYCKEKECDEDNAIWDINRKYYPRTIAKLLDEYNYITITRGISVNSGADKRIDESIKVGDTFSIRAIEGRDGRPISRAEDGRIILFDEADPNIVKIQIGDVFEVKVIRAEPNFIIARKISKKKKIKPPIQPTPPTVIELFNKYLKYSNFIAGEGIHENSVATWMKARREAKQYYMDKFSPQNIDSITREELDSFLYFRNNRAWTMLYRQGKSLVRNFEESKRNIVHLQDESITIQTRINNVMRGGHLWVRGFGKNITTGILHTCDSKDQYGVWNNRSKDGLKILGRSVKIHYKDHGISYVRINNELNKLKEELNTDLVLLDGFMWYVSKIL